MTKPQWRKRILVTLVLSTALVATACSSGSGGSSSGSGGSGGDSKNPSVTLKLATAVNPDDIIAKALDRLAAGVSDKTSGAVKIKIYPNGQLGGDKETQQGVTNGTIGMVVEGSTGNAGLDGLNTPYLFKDQAELDAVLKSDAFAPMVTDLEQKQKLKVVGYLARMPRELTANKSVNTLADMQGLKLRVPQLPTMIDVFRSIGANPTTMDITELFTSLQTGVVAAEENPVSQIYTMKFYEAQKYLMITDHTYAPMFVMMNSDAWNALSDSQQTAIRSAMAEASTWDAQQTASLQDSYVSKLRDKGMTVVRPNNAAFREKAAPAVKSILSALWGADIYTKVEDVINKGA